MQITNADSTGAVSSLLLTDKGMQTTVAGAIARLTGDPQAVVTTMTVEPVDYYVQVATTKSLSRIKGTASSPNRDHQWSIFVKEVGPPNDGQPEARWNDWRLEALVYRHGLLPNNETGLNGPEVYGVVDTTDGALILLEDINGLSARTWPLERYRSCAVDLGYRQAKFLLDNTASKLPFLSPDLFESYMLRPKIREVMALISDDEIWETSYARAAFPRIDHTRKQLMTLWERKGELFEALRALPQTMSLGDVWPPNLFSVDKTPRDRRTVAIDPSWALLGPAGQDLATLVHDSVYEGMIPIAQLLRLERHVIAGYVEGFQRGGVAVDGKDVRFAFQAVSGMRFGFEAAAFLEDLSTEGGRQLLETLQGRGIYDIARDGGSVISSALRHGEHALATLDGRVTSQQFGAQSLG